MTVPEAAGSAEGAVDGAFDRIAADGSAGIFIELVDRSAARAAARHIDASAAAGHRLPLAGCTVAVKGNIDVAGHRTTAGCPAYGEVPEQSAVAVRALESAGAVVVAVTNLDQFATGLAGTRSPHGVCPNAHWPELISGGSSSGSAVAVARGLVDLALGTDTAGSGRVPAAANGIVGLKPTRGWVSAGGVVPACRSLDCVSVFASTVGDGWAALQTIAGFDPGDPWSRRPPPSRTSVGRPANRIGTAGPRSTAVSRRLADAELEAVEVDLEPFLAAGRLLYEGAFVAERYAAVGAFVDAHPDAVDPVVRAIISNAATLPAWQLDRDVDELARLRRITEATWERVDVLVVPSVPRIPTLAEALADPVATSAELGTYTNFVNLLDLCAVTIPIGPPTDVGPPESVTLIAPAWEDATLAQLARRLMPGTVASHRTG